MADLEFRYGPMNSGKSMNLLQTAYNYEENNKKVILIKSVIDIEIISTYSDVSTKTGEKIIAIVSDKNIEEMISD